MQYIGQTNQQVPRRMNSHRFDINTYDGQGYATNVALHQLTILDFFLSMLSIMRWIVSVRKFTGFINLILCIQKA